VRHERQHFNCSSPCEPGLSQQRQDLSLSLEAVGLDRSGDRRPRFVQELVRVCPVCSRRSQSFTMSLFVSLLAGHGYPFEQSFLGPGVPLVYAVEKMNFQAWSGIGYFRWLTSWVPREMKEKGGHGTSWAGLWQGSVCDGCWYAPAMDLFRIDDGRAAGSRRSERDAFVRKCRCLPTRWKR